MNLKIDMGLRPCIVNDKKALFHRWNEISNVVDASPFIGGHPGGIIKFTRGIIEYEDGTISECNPTEIRFVDRIFNEYCFE